METRQMTPLFIYFSTVTVCNIHFWIWKFMWFPFPFGSFWPASAFGYMLLILTAHHTFSENSHSEVTKKYDSSTRWSQILIFSSSSSWTKWIKYPYIQQHPLSMKPKSSHWYINPCFFRSIWTTVLINLTCEWF